MNGHTNYLALFFLIAAAATVGNLASHAIQTAFWMVAWQESIDQFQAELDRTFGDADERAENTRRQIQAQREANDQRIRQQRERSPTAERLASHCRLWRKNHDMTPTETTARAVGYYCGGYDRFIETGRRPKGDAPLLETR